MDTARLPVLIAVGLLIMVSPLLVHRSAPLLRLSNSRLQRPPVGKVIRFASSATELDMHTRALKDSCAPNNVEFIGVGTVWESTRNKIDHLLQWIRNLDPDTLVVVLDSNDAACLPCDRDLRTEYLLLGHDIVFGGTFYSFPDKAMSDWHPIPPEKPETWRRYLNSGTIMGRASAIQYYCTRYYLRPGRHHDDALNDQRFWTDQFLAGYNELQGSDEPTIGIDYDGRLFQVLGDREGCGKGCWGLNTTTGFVQVKAECQEQLYSGPACILHGPGNGKKPFWNLTGNLDRLRNNTDPWVDLF